MKLTFDLRHNLLIGVACLVFTHPIMAEDELPFLTKVIAHRGASYEAPENTQAAIQLAIDKRAKIIEFDVRETSDGKLFLFHDSELERLCKLKGTFEALTADQAQQLDVGKWFTKAAFPNQKPPTLTDSIQQCLDANCIPLIEHKSGKPEAYAEAIKKLDAVDRVIVQSFDWKFIAAIRKLIPELKIGALGKRSLSARKKELLDLKPDWVGWSERYIGSSDLTWLKENNFKIAIWTVNERKRTKYLIENGVDQIITDRPKYIAKGFGEE